MAKESDDKKNAENEKRSFSGRLASFILALIVLVTFIVALANYRFPDFFNPEFDQAVTGDALMGTLIDMGEEMTDNWMPNDMFYPTVLLDNPQNFQLGELEVLRYTVRVLRDNLSRQRTTDRIDPDADAAYTKFSNDPLKWVLPSAESKFREGLGHLESFRSRMAKGEAHTYPRADNLIELLNQLNSLLGGVSTRLSNIPNDYNEFLSEETAGDNSSNGERKITVKVSSTDVDDQFYFAQGVAFGIRQVMLAVSSDFSEILKLKKATELMSNVILILEHTQWEPKYVVMNCSPGSWFPCQNDPMMLASRLQDARQKIRSLISMIEN